MFRRLLSIAALCAYAAAKIASADVLVGDYRGVAPGPVLRFGPEQSGNRAPLASLTTQQDGNVLESPLHLAYEPVENVVYVSDFYGRAIRVYPAGASGNATPLRTLTGPLGQPRQVTVDAAHDELIAIVSGCCLSTFPRTADGSVSARRQIFWGGTGGPSRLDSPVNVHYLAATDEVVVADIVPGQGGANRGELLFFARTASGDAAPTRAIEGAATRLGDHVAGLAYVPAHGELVALVRDGDDWRIVTFAQDASGNVAPTRVLEGPDLGIVYGRAITYDALTDRLYVVSGTSGLPNSSVLAFARTATGNAAPVRRIAGSRTGFEEPVGIVAVPGADWIFADRFDAAD
ncbi:lactonase family protein [Tahibacter soli]|uniref:Lactonase family protein n=1 Tax=Tahibacter soli TaxID=2983605 RepID=A0A9X3YJB1_9GAMM|nr:lactonase family protein [Tahibacter soli]MDC8013434.1 lactonase family protein [Tahibacter soli]